MNSATKGMETAVEMETLAATVEPQAVVISETEERIDQIDCPGGVISRSEKRERMGRVCRVLACYLRIVSPVKMLKKVRDWYVVTLGSCAQSYAIAPPGYGMALNSYHGSPLPAGLLKSVREDVYGTDFCIRPVVRKSFDGSVLELRCSGAFAESDPGASPFRKSFSDFENCLSPKMRRTYSDAAALSSRPRGYSHAGYCGRSPVWAPSRALGCQTMMIFPIEEAPELILASFRKEAQELRLAASFRKELHRKDGGLPEPSEEDIKLPCVDQVILEDGCVPPQASMSVPSAV